MAKRKKRQPVLPETIELISSKTGMVREFSTDHAFRLLRLQDTIGMGSYELFNTHLYKYEDSGITVIETEQPKDSRTTGLNADWGEPSSEPNGGVLTGEDKESEE